MKKIKKMNRDKELEVDSVTGAILKASFEVMNHVGHGFQEAIYQRALNLELTQAGLEVEREVQFPMSYKGNPIGMFIADFVVENSVIVELKALDAPLQPAHFGQCLNYMRVSALNAGLLINFGRPKLEYRRLNR